MAFLVDGNGCDSSAVLMGTENFAVMVCQNDISGADAAGGGEFRCV